MNTNSVSDARIADFWAWFSSVSCELGEGFSKSSILKELDDWVLSFGGPTWELGPGLMKANSLTISPNGREELLPLTERIVAAAPESETWEFHAAKPAKTWNLCFTVEGEGGTRISVDANEWRYVLHRFPDSTFDITVRAPNLPEDKGLRCRAVDIAVEGLIGERTMLERIGDIDIVDEFPDDVITKSTGLAALAEHLAALVGE